jgi:hypothetical protein
MYDVLNDRNIYDPERYKEEESSKNKRLSENVPTAVIISLKREENNSFNNIYSSTYIIMEYLRDNYLVNFNKYSRHLT